MKPTVSSVHFCPIKSLSFQKVNSLIIKKDIGIEEDRIFAFSRGLNELDAKRREKYLKTKNGKMYLGNRLKSYLNAPQVNF